MSLLGWAVFAHVFAVIVSFGAHGVSAWAMFAVRRETDRARMAAILDLSGGSMLIGGIGLLLAIVLGIAAAVIGDDFRHLWPWASIVVLVIVIGAMTPFAGIPMNNLRRALGLRVQGDKATDPARVPGTDEDVAAARAQIRPELPAAIGIAGIAILVWLMQSKPF